MLIGAVDNTITQQNLYANRAEVNQKADAIDKAEDVSKTGLQKPSGALNEPRDEYIPSGDKPGENAGIYRLEKSEDGMQKIVFDRPDSPEKSEKATSEPTEPDAASPEVAPKESESEDKAQTPEKADDKKADRKTTVDTSNVDREIKKLKEEKKQIQQELKNASDDEEKHKDLERRLSQVEAELSAKDNDGYRKQNSTYTNG